MPEHNLVLKTIVVGQLSANCYVLGHKPSGRAFIVDPGAEAGKIKGYLRDKRLQAEFVLHTHGHIDHIGADKELGLPVYIHREDKDCLFDARANLSGFMGSPFSLSKTVANILEDNQEIEFVGLRLKIIHTPGHSPGGICILLGNMLFSGDTLFAAGIGRTDLAGGSRSRLINSIKQRLFCLDEHTVVYPGHGPATTIAREKRENPYLTL
ncbi:MAG: MBL fold metallo-hydrolase [Candidatus Omnitrophota bacterium]